MGNRSERIDAYFGKVSAGMYGVNPDRIDAAISLLMEARRAGRTIYVFGNGGSAATASHLVCDLAKSLSTGSGRGFQAVCLSDSVPAMMAYANDIGWDEVFAAPLAGRIEPGDVAIALSASGSSRNVHKALERARTAGAGTVAFCGFDGGTIKALDDVALHVPSNEMKVVEDVHLVLCHCIVQMLAAEIAQDHDGAPRNSGPSRT
jgi:D-sedoheptulose 7-phosphate isomerase